MHGETTTWYTGRRLLLLVKKVLHIQMIPARRSAWNEMKTLVARRPWWGGRKRREIFTDCWFPITCILSSEWYSSVCTHFFTFTLMMTGAFSWNVRKVFFRLNCRTQLWTLKNSLVKNSLMKNFKIFTKHWISSGFHQMYVTAITRCTLHLSLL